MSNDEVHAAGLLNRALDPATQPPEIQAFLHAELDLLHSVITEGMRVIDVGCGTGRHLLRLRNRLRLGVGVDYEHSYIGEAHRRAADGHLHFVTADATAIPVLAAFDFAMCLTNTWGTMSDKAGVLREMRRVAPKPHTRVVSVYSEASVPSRREWYCRLGHAVLEETREYLEQLNRRYRRDVQLYPDVMATFRAHSWPRNIRELEEAVHRLVVGGAMSPVH